MQHGLLLLTPMMSLKIHASIRKLGSDFWHADDSSNGTDLLTKAGSCFTAERSATHNIVETSAEYRQCCAVASDTEHLCTRFRLVVLSQKS